MYNQFNQQPYQYIRSNGITWVQGIEGAKAFQLTPNSNIILMDSETDNIFYIKTSDNVGMCNLRMFKFEEITNTPKSQNLDQYVRKDELEQLLNELLGGSNGKQSLQPVKSDTAK